jgi:hypothetical protein
MRFVSVVALAAMVAFVLFVPMKGADTQTPDVEQQLASLSDASREAEANGDVAWQESHLARDFTAIGPDGELRSRIDVIRAGTPVVSEALVVLDQKVRVYGNTAVVLTRTALKARAGMPEVTGGSWLTSVWVRENGAWKQAAFQSTSVAAHH